MKYVQLSLFPIEGNKLQSDDSIEDERKLTEENTEEIQIRSEKILSEMDIMELPFLGCDFDVVYPQIKQLIPKEKVQFDKWELPKMIMAEIVCAGICHQMNWDFLRNAIYEKMKMNPEWISPNNLLKIEPEEISLMFAKYDRQERVRPSERAFMLNCLAKWAVGFDSIENVFLDDEREILPENDIREKLLKCEVFSSDSEEKKLQLLLQKLSMYHILDKLSEYCHPAIDYHLIRMYYRRGLIYGKTKYAREYLRNPLPERKEETVASVRHLCKELMDSICDYTELSVSDINQIDWHIGRSVCLQEHPDCKLETGEAEWLKSQFHLCPYYNTCSMRMNNYDYSKMKEPNYGGTSY